jgi:hypothetical protein
MLEILTGKSEDGSLLEGYASKGEYSYISVQGIIDGKKIEANDFHQEWFEDVKDVSDILDSSLYYFDFKIYGKGCSLLNSLLLYI